MTEDRQQIIYALERNEHRLRHEAELLMRRGDYSAELYSEDADRMREAMKLIQDMP